MARRVRPGWERVLFRRVGAAPVDPGPTPTSPVFFVFDLPLSFGQGEPGTDDNIPDVDGVAQSFWLSPTLDADHAWPEQSREWPTPDPLDFVSLIVYVDAADLAGAGGRLIVTADGVDTDTEIQLSAGVSAGLTLTDEGDAYVPANHRIGVRFAPDNGCTGGTLRLEARLRGRWPKSGELPTPTRVGGVPLIWLEADTGVTRDPSDNVTQWTNQGSLGLGVGQPPTIFAGPPLWVADQQNGLPIIRFVDATALLTSDVVTPFAVGAPFTFVVVSKITSAAGGFMFSSPFQDGSPLRGVGLLTNAGAQYPFPSEFTGAGPSLDDGPVDYTGQVLLCAFYFDGDPDNGRVDINNVRQALTGTIDTPVAGDAYCIGGACVAGFNGAWKGSDQDLMAIVGYAGDLDGSAAIAQTIAYLTAKWGLTP